jgi:hypothetical protein
MMVFQVIPNSKIKCMKRSNRTIISLVNHFGVNIIKLKLYQFLSKKINTSVRTKTTPAPVTKVLTMNIINQLSKQFLKLITQLLNSNSLIRASTKLIKTTNTLLKFLLKFKRLRMNHS